MCTLAVLPSPRGGYLVGHNRDESLRRAGGVPPRRGRRAGRTFLCPRDPQGGGSWIGVNDRGVCFCLLNARDEATRRFPDRPRSRGLVLWEILHLGSVEQVVRRFSMGEEDLADVRAFHMVVVERGRGPRPIVAARLRWNGLGATWDRHSAPSLFVSSGFDQAGAERGRGGLWRKFLRLHPRPDASALASWLGSHDAAPGPLSVCMHRPEAATVSRTIVSVGPDGIVMSYLDGPPCDPGSRETIRRLTLA